MLFGLQVRERAQQGDAGAQAREASLLDDDETLRQRRLAPLADDLAELGGRGPA